MPPCPYEYVTVLNVSVIVAVFANGSVQLHSTPFARVCLVQKPTFKADPRVYATLWSEPALPTDGGWRLEAGGRALFLTGVSREPSSLCREEGCFLSSLESRSTLSAFSSSS